jgi:hypothetical protein
VDFGHEPRTIDHPKARMYLNEEVIVEGPVARVMAHPSPLTVKNLDIRVRASDSLLQRL